MSTLNELNKKNSVLNFNEDGTVEIKKVQKDAKVGKTIRLKAESYALLGKIAKAAGMTESEVIQDLVNELETRIKLK